MTEQLFLLRHPAQATSDFMFDLQRFAENVTYLDADGATQTAPSATNITSDTTALTAGWYVVDSDITINHTLTISGEVHLILAANAKLTVNGDTGYGIHCTTADGGTNSSLEIFVQSLGSGELIISNTANDKAAVKFDDGCNLTINGGKITATATNYRAMDISDDLTINGGQITA